MEARLLRAVVLAAALASLGASYRTENFLVTASSPRLAEKIGRTAEHFRKTLAVDWLGRELPRWNSPCPITAQVAPNLGAGGATSFVFQNGQVGGWRMTIQGSEQRLLDSVLPHEVTHTIFATHFRQPLPRWADEGACTTVEHPVEKDRHKRMLIEFLQTNRGISFSRMFAMKEYPPDVLPLYAQGYSLARYLIEQRGRRKFVDFVGDGLRDENWVRALNSNYGYQNLMGLQTNWLAWVKRGSPPLVPAAVKGQPAPELLAKNGKRVRPEPNLLLRVGLSQPSDTPARTAATPAPRSAETKARPRRPSPQGWYAAGQRPATNVPQAVTHAPGASPHQAVRQQPIQRPKQTVLR